MSIAILVVAILVGVLFVVFHTRRHAQPSITGIGVQLGVRDRALQIMGVVPDTPAAKAGLHPGLVIQQIDGTDIVGKPLVECVSMTRGPVGSKVQLEVIDPAKSETNIVEFTREKIPVPGGTTLK
ncbi:MAG TPA: PDZ domain-containing protein [Verrucomicrobiae bacterium]